MWQPTQILKPVATCALLLACLATFSACSGSRTAYTNGSDLPRDIAKSEKIYQRAVSYRIEDPVKAEKLLREALENDLYNGPAHNDLGVLLQEQGKLYDAASEFEWARKLMPGNPEPRLNLAIVLSTGGKVEAALAAAETALEVRPGYLPAVQTLAVLQLKYQHANEKTDTYLRLIATNSNSAEWRNWAQKWILKRET
jgi:Flp pilus assembly protein TadD